MNQLDTGVLYCEDNLAALSRLPEESVDLIYLDPPFFSKRLYEVIWGDEAEIRSFEDRWDGGLNHYIGWMRDRVRAMHRVLKPHGSIYLHSDPHASHYLKVMLDDIFGPERFRSEIIWKRSSAHSDGKQGRRQHGRIHDVILYYTKSDSWTWNQLYTPYDTSYVDNFYDLVEPETERRYQLGDITGPGGASKGNPEYEVMGVRRHWRYSQEKMAELIREGRVVQPKPGAVPRMKRYLDEMPGVALQDIWSDIKPIGARARERLGYPTQKPEELLKRVIETSSDPGDVVLDPFCGCGTTISAAHQTARRWVGIDISTTAINVVKARMDRMPAPSRVRVVGMPETPEDLRQLKPFEFQNWVIRQLYGTHSPRKSGDMGIDGYSFLVGHPIQVKRSDRVGRNVIDNFQTAMRRGGFTKGYVVAFSFTRNAREEVARARWHDQLEVELLTVQDLLRPNLERRVPELASVTQLPLPPTRSNEARPTAEELIASDADAEAI